MGVGDVRRKAAGQGRAVRRPEPVTLSRVLGEGEDPLTWSLPVFNSESLHVRLHFVFVLMAVWELILSDIKSRVGPSHVVIAVCALLVLVGARELGRWFLTSRTGNAPDQIVLWPLGLLTTAGYARLQRPGVLGAVGGLTVNAVLAPLLGGALWLCGLGWDGLLFNPLAPGTVLGQIGSLGVVVLWWLYYLNLVLLGVNLVVPMLPLDAGRIVEAVLARRLDTHRAAIATCRIGLLTALVLFVAAMSADLTRVMGLAVFGFGVCWIHLRRVEFVHRPEGVLAPPPPPLRSEPQTTSSMEPDAQHKPSDAAGDTAEVDRVLAKISSSGLASLTPDEQRTLAEATERRRNSRAVPPNNR